jgi:hypothetical protein
MMRTSTLKPSKPLKQGRPLARKTPMSRGSGSKAPAAGAGLLRVAAIQAKAAFPRSRESKPTKAPKPMKSRGMKGRPPTAEEVRFMDAIASLGCVACRKDGIANPWGSIHHIDGRTKPGAHFLVLFLCAGHHQAGTGENKTLIAVHPDKARFEGRYGTQRELLAECISMITNSETATVAAGAVSEQITVE